MTNVDIADQKKKLDEALKGKPTDCQIYVGHELFDAFKQAGWIDDRNEAERRAAALDLAPPPLDAYYGQYKIADLLSEPAEWDFKVP